MSITPIGTSTSTAPAQNPYQQEYATLQSMDTQELLNVTFGSWENAQSNVLSVLSQWAAFQAEQQAAQDQTHATNNVPSLGDLVSQSDAQANSVLSNYASAPSGSSIIDYQA